MDYFKEQITNSCKHIDRCISRIKDSPEQRLEQSTNIANSLRQLAEHCSCLVYEQSSGDFYDYSSGAKAYSFYDEKAKTFIKQSRYRYIDNLHECFQSTNAHQSNFDDENLRVLISQFENLVQIKDLLKTDFGMDVLPSLNKFPLEMDETFESYYRAIFGALESANPCVASDKDHYYVQNQRLIYLDGKKLFEITVYPVMSQRAPTNRIIVFSRTAVSTLYAVQLELIPLSLSLFSTPIVIYALRKWSVSIRPCEFEGLDWLMGLDTNHNRGNADYICLMKFLTETVWTIPEIVTLNDEDFSNITIRIFGDIRKGVVIRTLERLRSIVQSARPGSNVLLYLSLTMDDELIDKQRPRPEWLRPDDDIGGGLHLSKGTLTFDKRPFSGKLLKHKPSISLLLRCFDSKGREDEIFAHRLEDFSNQTGRIYQDYSQEDISVCDSLMKKYNAKVTSGNEIKRVGNHFYLQANEDLTHRILSAISILSKKGDSSYASRVDGYLPNKSIDDDYKRDIVSRLFVDSSVAFLCGRAGTGKSLTINYICEIFADKKILVLAQTHPTLDRLKHLITQHNVTFCTIESATFAVREADLLIIDESSVVSNRDFNFILEKVTFEKAVFVGDPYQLQAIEFGNWFELGMKVFRECVFELKSEFRCTNYPRLKKLWGAVRNGDSDLEKALQELHVSKPLGREVFERHNNDEIVLCLNYNGLYGINCINDYLQSANPETAHEINHRTFKRNDPILFIDSARFRTVIHNNTKGIIKEITPYEGGLSFRLFVEADLRSSFPLEYIFHGYKDGVSDISIGVWSSGGKDDKQRRKNCVVPFQLAYAVSIHKAQGLEYDSVKIVIANDVEEKITSNVFYTAITRAKRWLTIFWTPESQSKIVKGLKKTSLSDDHKIFFKQHPYSLY